MCLVTGRERWWGARERTLVGGEGEGEGVSKLESTILEHHDVWSWMRTKPWFCSMFCPCSCPTFSLLPSPLSFLPLSPFVVGTR